MGRTIVAALTLLSLAACGKPAAAVDPCHPPKLLAAAAPGTYGADREAATNCVRQAAYALTRAGGPITNVAAAAVERCAAQEKSISGHGEPLYDWQRTQIHEDLLHVGKATAVQSRAIGCGRAPGEPADTV